MELAIERFKIAANSNRFLNHNEEKEKFRTKFENFKVDLLSVKNSRSQRNLAEGNSRNLTYDLGDVRNK
jgi:hypothetical protein